MLKRPGGLSRIAQYAKKEADMSADLLTIVRPEDIYEKKSEFFLNSLNKQNCLFARESKKHLSKQKKWASSCIATTTTSANVEEI